MNREYIYLDGRVIVEDEVGNKQLRNYSSNIDEILVKENVIEVIEDELEQVKKDRQVVVKDIKNYENFWSVPIFVVFLSGVFSVFLTNFLLMETGSYIVNTTFGSMELSKLVGLFVFSSCLFLEVGISVSDYFLYKRMLRKEKGLSNKKEKLESDLLNFKEELEILRESAKNNVSESIEKGFRVEKVDDKKALNCYEGYANLYYDCGYNEDKYYKYYQSGVLDEKLKKYYTELGVEEVKDYLEEKKGLSLVKRRKTYNRDVNN